MRPKINKETKQTIKLPSIANKTMGDIFKQPAKQKQRPLSSNNVVTDLEKKLFSQLQTYDQKSYTCKMQKSSNKAKGKTKSTILANSCKDISGSGKNNQSESMQKIAQLMPQLYSKIIQSKKYDEVKPLKQTLMFNNQDLSSKQLIPSNQLKKVVKMEKTASIQGRTSSRVKQLKSQKALASEKQVKETKQKKQVKQFKQAKQIRQIRQATKEVKQVKQDKQIKDSFDFAQCQIQRIYQQYLQNEGLSTGPQTSIQQLASINKDLNKCQVDIEQLQKNYSSLIQQLGDLCINDFQ